jgi:ubiquitin C-terminal hydrolase
MLLTVEPFIKSLSDKGGDLVKSIVSSAQEVSDTSVTGAASARQIKCQMDRVTDKFQGFEQCDAHEFLGDLIDNIHEEVVKSESTELLGDNSMQIDSIRSEPAGEASFMLKIPTDEFFRCDINACLICKSCGHTR